MSGKQHGYNPNRDKNGQFSTGKKLPVDPENLRIIAQALPLNTTGTQEEFDASVAATRAAFEIVLRDKKRKYHAENPLPEPPQPEPVPYVEPEPVEFTYEEAVAFSRLPMKEKQAGDYNYQHYRAAAEAIRKQEEEKNAYYETNSTLIASTHDCWDPDCPNDDTCVGRDKKNTYDYLITGPLADRIRQRAEADDTVEVHIREHHNITYYSEETGTDLSRNITLELSNGFTLPILAEDHSNIVVSLEYWFTTTGEQEDIYKPYGAD